MFQVAGNSFLDPFTKYVCNVNALRLETIYLSAGFVTKQIQYELQAVETVSDAFLKVEFKYDAD